MLASIYTINDWIRHGYVTISLRILSRLPDMVDEVPRRPRENARDPVPHCHLRLKNGWDRV